MATVREAFTDKVPKNWWYLGLGFRKALLALCDAIDEILRAIKETEK